MAVIDDVEPGMRVVDADGQEVGTVVDVKMGDPAAATAQGEEPLTGGSLLDTVSLTGTEPDVPEEMRSRLLRLGFLKIDGKGLFTGDLFVAADRVDRVEGDTVRLSVGKDEVVGES
ncbi:MAG: hypothetical protein ACLGIA_03575 [Actinomycetes bacterium]